MGITTILPILQMKRLKQTELWGLLRSQGGGAESSPRSLVSSFLTSNFFTFTFSTSPSTPLSFPLFSYIAPLFYCYIYSLGLHLFLSSYMV